MSDTISLGFKLSGEDDMKRALTDISNALKVNASEMTLVSAKYDENGKSVEALNAKNQVLKSSIENEQKSMSTLKAAIESTSAAHSAAGKNIDTLKNNLEAAKNKMTEMQSSTGATKAELLAQQTAVKSLSKELGTAEKAYTTTGNNTTKWTTQLNTAEAKVITMNKQLGDNEKALKKAETGTSSLGDKVKNIANVLGTNVSPALETGISKLDKFSTSGAALTLTVAGIVTALGKMSIQVAENIDSMSELAQQSGLTIQEVEGLKFATNMLNTDFGTVQGALTKLTKNMSTAQKGTGDAAETFKKLGVSVIGSNGHLNDSEETFYKVIDALGKMNNETERDAAAMTLMGKSAQDLNPLIEAGSTKIRGYIEEAKKLGLVTGDDTNESFLKLSDSLKIADAQWDALKIRLSQDILPVITAVIETFNEIPTPVLYASAAIATIITVIVMATKTVQELTMTWAAIKGVMAVTDAATITSTAKIIAITLALVALAAIIAVIIGKSAEVRSTMNSISGLNSGSPSSKKMQYNARGTNDFIGGYSVVGEEGPEIVELPAHSKVYPNGIIPKELSTQYAYQRVPRYARGANDHPGGAALVGEEGSEFVGLPTGSKSSSTTQSTVNNYYNVTIDAKNVKEFNDIIKFANQASRFKVQMG